MGEALKGTTVAIGNTATTILTCPVGGSIVIQSLSVGNVDAAADCAVTVTHNRNGAGDLNFITPLNVEIGKAVVVYGGAAGRCFLCDNGTPDVLKLTAAVAGDLVADVAYIERT